MKIRKRLIPFVENLSADCLFQGLVIFYLFVKFSIRWFWLSFDRFIESIRYRIIHLLSMGYFKLCQMLTLLKEVSIFLVYRRLSYASKEPKF